MGTKLSTILFTFCSSFLGSFLFANYVFLNLILRGGTATWFQYLFLSSSSLGFSYKREFSYFKLSESFYFFLSAEVREQERELPMERVGTC